MNENYKYVTLLSTDDYILGTLCLAKSLRKVHSRYDLLVLCSQQISDLTIHILQEEHLDFLRLDSSLNANVNKESKFHRWNYTFDKLNIYNLVQYNKIVFLDSDMYVLRNIDHLFGKTHMSAVVADLVEQPDCIELNSGLMVIEPSTQEYEGLIGVAKDFMSEGISYYGDQDIIRSYFSNWSETPEIHLPIQYNMFYPSYDKCTRMACGGGGDNTLRS